MAEPFKFEYTMPFLDWYKIIKRTVTTDDYDWFELQLRYGSSWWLIGHKVDIERNDTKKDIGRLSKREAVRFIEWAEREGHGNNPVEISAISSSLNLAKEIGELLEIMKDG